MRFAYPKFENKSAFLKKCVNSATDSISVLAILLWGAVKGENTADTVFWHIYNAFIRQTLLSWPRNILWEDIFKHTRKLTHL